MDIRLKKYIGMCIVLLALLLIDFFYYFYVLQFLKDGNFTRDNVFMILNIYRFYLVIKIVIFIVCFKKLNVKENYFIKGAFSAKLISLYSILACSLLLMTYILLIPTPFYIGLLPTVLTSMLLWTIRQEYRQLKKQV